MRSFVSHFAGDTGVQSLEAVDYVVEWNLLMRQKPELLAELFQDLMRQFSEGSLSPLPYRVFPISNVASAFRYMAQAKPIGKVVIANQEPDVLAAPPTVGEMTFRDDATYLMTGGLGGIGLSLGEELAREAKAKLVLVSRSGLPDRDAWDAWIQEHA